MNAPKTVLAIMLGVAALALPGAFPPAPRLVWNASASAPEGLYRVVPGQFASRGEMVVARPPDPWRALAARRHYLPANALLVKRIGAIAGDEVCALGKEIFVNGVPAVSRRRVDGLGRPMPWWDGCRRLDRGQLFLLSDRPESFDGRYFGVIRRADIVGRAVLLWRR